MQARKRRPKVTNTPGWVKIVAMNDGNRLFLHAMQQAIHDQNNRKLHQKRSAAIQEDHD